MSASEGAVQVPSLVHDPTLYNISSPVQPNAAGHIFGGGDFAWLLSPSGRLSVFRSTNGNCICQLALVPSGHRVAVSCSCELVLPSEEVASLLVLAVNIDGVVGKTTIVVINPLTSRVLRTLKIPRVVSSLCGVSRVSLQAAAGLFWPSSLLRGFSGVLAVGCAGGHLLLVDLAIGDSSLKVSSVQRPRALAFVESLQTPPTAVASARSSGKHACVDILASCHNKDQFTYASTGQVASRSFPSDSLAITALHFVPQIVCLLIGYSVGGFQLYNFTKAAAIIYSSTCPKVPTPVTHFTYQEPENDPKNNVYLWVARGNPRNICMNVETKVMLYQLLFSQKIDHGAGIVYEQFIRCGPGFSYPLTPTPTKPLANRSLASTLLHCRTIEMNRPVALDESHDTAAHGPDLTVAVFVWGCGDPTHNDVIVGVFDLNQYYHNQVPKKLQWRSSGRHSGVLGCSYFAFYSLKKMTDKNTILDAAVLGVSPFLSLLPPIPETHMWPTSLSFDVTAITNEGFLQCSCLGLQRMALEQLELGGVATLSQPLEVFGMCERADLLGVTWDVDHNSMEAQQKALLSVACEHHMIPLLKSCALVWMNGGADSYFSMFVDWLRDSLEDMKIKRDEICHQLFSEVTTATDSINKTSLLLDHLRMKYSLFSNLLTSLLAPLSSSPHITQLSAEDTVLIELSQFYITATTSHMLIRVIMWCLENNVIPVATGSHTVYPALKRLYSQLRSKVSRCKLSVDHLCEDLELEYHYPPDDLLQGLMAIFITRDTIAHHCLMMYFICDICNLKGSDFDQEMILSSYSEQFRLPKQLKYLTRGLWSLDHLHYEKAVGFLNGCVLGTVLWFPWQHSVIVSLLLKAADPTLALDYIIDNDNAVEDQKLILRVYIASHQCIWKAIKLVRESDDSVVDELFNHFLDLCFEYKCLSEVVYIPMNALEDAFFCSYLESCPSFKAQELLVMHYAIHNRFGEAISMQARIKPLAMVDPDPGAKERSQFRDTLLERYGDTAPAALAQLWRSLETEPVPTHPTESATRARNPPLSSVLAKSEASTKVTSSVELVYQAMKQIRDDLATDTVSPFRKNVSSTVPSTPFFSHPPSIRKAMLSRRKTTAVQATPVSQKRLSRVSTPVHRTPGTGMASGHSTFQTHMEKFKERMFQMSQTVSFDPSIITTPSVDKSVMSSHYEVVTVSQPPTSILKVKPTNEGGGEGERGEGEERSETNTITRRIRFAEERTVLSSPITSLSGGSSSSATTATATASVPMETPLPSGDDSDLFYSFTDSPDTTPLLMQAGPHRITQLTPAQSATPSQSPLPKTKLFIGADDDYEEQQQQQKDEEEVMEGTSSEYRETPQNEDKPVSKVTATSTTPTPQRIRIPLVTLKREGIRFRSSPSPSPLRGDMGSKSTPTSAGMGSGYSGGRSSLFAPHRPSPLSHSVTSQSPNRPSPLSKQQQQRTASPSATIQLGRPDMSTVGSLGRPEMRSLSRQVMNEPSATMVPVLVDPQMEREEQTDDKTTETKTYQLSSPVTMATTQRPPVEALDLDKDWRDIGSGSRYHFSPGKIVSNTPPPSRQEEIQNEGMTKPEFVFSPPFTRSAARRAAAEAKRTGLVTVGTGVGVSTAARGERKSITSGRSYTARIDLVTPPSQQATPTTTGTKQGQRSRRKVTASHGSRSTRLVQDRKAY